MKNKKQVSYMIQATSEGGYDIVQNTQQGKIVGHTDNEQAAIIIVEYLTKYNQ